MIGKVFNFAGESFKFEIVLHLCGGFDKDPIQLLDRFTTHPRSFGPLLKFMSFGDNLRLAHIKAGFIDHPDPFFLTIGLDMGDIPHFFSFLKKIGDLFIFRKKGVDNDQSTFLAA